jgi:serine/threonine protein phosphatase PrpC
MFRVYSATIIGNSHISLGRPNEDNFFVGRGPADWLACVVSDGCGSAAQAATGSKLISELVGEALLRTATRIEKKGAGEWIIDDILAELASCKIRLRDIVKEELRAYHATVVATLISPRGGFLLHIGDGIAASFVTTHSQSNSIAIKQDTTSNPENGEYANETFYLTEPSWIKHTRLTPLTASQCVMLCSDGAQDVLFDRNDISSNEFLEILKSVGTSDNRTDLVIKTLLTSDFAKKRSSDDKTVLFIISDQLAATIGSDKRINFEHALPRSTPPVHVKATPRTNTGTHPNSLPLPPTPPKPNTSRLLQEYRLPVLLALLSTLFLGALLGIAATHIVSSFLTGDRTETKVAPPSPTVPVPETLPDSTNQNPARALGPK